MKKILSILLVLVFALGCGVLCPVALCGEDKDMTEDEAAYEAMRRGDKPDDKGEKSGGTTGSPRLSKQTPSKLGSRGPSKLGSRGGSKLKSGGSSKFGGANSGPYYIVATGEFDGSTSYSVMTSAEIREAKSKLRTEGSYLGKAHLLARKQWKADGNNHAFTFRCPKTRQLKPSRKYIKREDASAKVKKQQKGAAKKKQALKKKLQTELKKASDEEKGKIKAARARQKEMSRMFFDILNRLISGEDAGQIAPAGSGDRSGPKKKATEEDALL